MARPKGSKDKAPRKPRKDTLERIAQTRGSILPNGKPNPEAPFGYSPKGIPLRRKPSSPPKSKEGKEALLRVAKEKGLVATIEPNKKDKGGRPEKYVDPEQVKQMALIGCTDQEIANITGLGMATVDRKFRGLIDAHRDQGKMSLRRLQLRIAQGRPGKVRVIKEDGGERVEEIEPGIPPSPQMAIHLGKHWLGQRDTAPTNSILVHNAQRDGSVLGPTLMTPETESRLALLFLEICPEAAEGTIRLDKSLEVA